MSDVKSFNEHRNKIKKEIIQAVADYFITNPDEIYLNSIFYIKTTAPLCDVLKKYTENDISSALNSLEESYLIKQIKHLGEGPFNFKIKKYMIDENPSVFEFKPQNYTLFVNKLANLKMYKPYVQLIRRTEIAQELGISLNESLYIAEEIESRNAIDFPANTSNEIKERIRIKEKILDLAEELEDEINNMSLQFAINNPNEFQEMIKKTFSEYGLTDPNSFKNVVEAVKMMNSSDPTGTILDVSKILIQPIPHVGGLIAESISLAQRKALAKKINKLLP